MTITMLRKDLIESREDDVRTLTELRCIAARLGLLEVDDPGWDRAEAELDRLLSELAHLAVIAGEPRSPTWQMIADDVDLSIVVKLRAVGTILHSLRSPRRASRSDASAPV